MRHSRRWACALLALTLALAPAGCAVQQDLTPVLEAGAPADSAAPSEAAASADPSAGAASPESAAETPAAAPAATPSAAPSAAPSLISPLKYPKDFSICKGCNTSIKKEDCTAIS